MRIVEGSAFVAAPLGGMTLAQMGADVIRFDAIGGGIDSHRWPVTPSGASLFWAGMNKGKRSLAVDVRKPEGQELVTALICGEGADAGIFLSNFPASGWLSDSRLRAQREDLIFVNIIGNPDGSTAVDYTVNPSSGLPLRPGPVGSMNQPITSCRRGTFYRSHGGHEPSAAERRRFPPGVGAGQSRRRRDVRDGRDPHVAQAQVLGESRPPIE
jgi:2-methylfumaryl-CoA isomerase